MIPVEWVSVLLVAIFAVVGIARGFPRELGATIAYGAMLFALSFVGERVGEILHHLFFRGRAGAPDVNLIQWIVVMAIIAGWVVIVYAGQTLTFAGKWPPNPLSGILFDGMIGLLNGWIVVWTAWDFTHRLGYPHRALGLFVPPLSERAETWVQWAPLALIPDAQETWLLGGFLAFLIFLRVVR